MSFSISERKSIPVYGECSDKGCISELAWSYVHTPNDTPSVYREPAPAKERFVCCGANVGSNP